MTTLLGVLFLFTTSSASAQQWFFPNTLVPTGGDRFSGAYLQVDVARGMNDASGKVNGVGGSVGFLGSKAGFRVGGATLDDQSEESEFTIGGAVAFDLLEAGADFQVALQGGVGWFDQEILEETATALRFPVGVALKFQIVDSETTMSHLWVMPRVEYQRVSYADESETDSAFALSAGISSQRVNGFGFYTSIDVTFPESDELDPEGGDEKPFILAGGISYRFGG
jgi:hypothetical protein